MRYFQRWQSLIAATAFLFVHASVRAQTPGPDYVPKRFDTYTASAALWRTDGSFQSVIRVKNVLAIAPMDVRLTLYMADGTPYALPPVHLSKSEVMTININRALANAPPEIVRHMSDTGSAALEYQYDWAGAVVGSISVLDKVRSLQFVNQFVFGDGCASCSQAKHIEKAATGNKGNTLEGLWWKYSAGSTVFVAVANPTATAQRAQLTVVNDLGRETGMRQIALEAHASIVSTLDDLIARNLLVGGIRVTYSGSPGSLLFTDGIQDSAVGYSAQFPLLHRAASASAASSCTVASAGLMIGRPDPMEGFPRAIDFSLFGFARNLTRNTVPLHAVANYMDTSGPHSVILKDELLAPQQALDLNLKRTVHVPVRDGAINVAFTYDAPCGAILLHTGSVDETGSYVFEVEPEGVGKSWGKLSHFWEAGAGTETMYSIWNLSAEEEDLIVTVYFERDGIYRYPLHLDPNASAMISMLELIRKGVPDPEGHMISPDARMGSLTIKNDSRDMRDAVTFVVSSGIYNPTAGTCCTNPTVCSGATGAQMTPSSATVPIGNTVSAQFLVTQESGGQQDYTYSASWSSGNTSVLQVNPGALSGIAQGSTTYSAGVSGIPLYMQVCPPASCQNGGEGASGSATVPDSTPMISGVVPDLWNSGTTTAVTITGGYFGTNAPTLNFSPSSGISYALSSYSDTQIAANITVTAGTPTEDVTVSVTNKGYGGQGFQSGGTGNSPTSATANVRIQAKMPWPEITVIAWVNKNAMSLPSGENTTLQSHLQQGSVNCVIDVLAWAVGKARDLNNTTDKTYAATWLVINSSNSQPPSTISPQAQLQSGDFRLFSDYGSSVIPTAQVGRTPNPCGGSVIPGWSSAADENPYNGYQGTSPSGKTYQINEGRVGSVGQDVNQTLTGNTTPWIWAVVEFDSSGNATTNLHQIFPTYSVYKSGSLIATYQQSALSTFTAMNESSQLVPSQVP